MIFGGTGDLTKRKLIPALYDLACIGCTNPNFDVLGIGRTQLSDEEFRDRMHEGAAEVEGRTQLQRRADGTNLPSGCITWWATPIDPDFYPQLKSKIAEMQKNGASKNVLFYVSTPASLAPPIVEGLGESGLARNTRRLDPHHSGKAFRS